MKLFKQITCAVLTLCLCAGLLLIPSAPVSAATGPSAPKAVDVSYYKNYPMVNDSAISVQLGTNGKNIKNIKTSSKNLKAKVTRLSLSSSSNSGYVGVYARKPVNTQYLLMYIMHRIKRLKNLLSKSM